MKALRNGWVIYLIVLSLGACAPEDQCRNSPSAGPALSILFIGNSYTYVNDLPGTFSRLACSGGHVVETDMAANGGWTLSEHVRSSQTLDKINSRKWDFVVLQEQSEVPAIPASRNQIMYPAVRQLAGLIKNEGAKPVLLLTWGHRDGDQTYGIANYTTMQAMLDQGYYGIANELRLKVIPAGDAWQKAVSQATPLDLWQGDGSHPNTQGTYLAACVFYAVIFQQSPLGLGYQAGLSQDQAQADQTIAAQTIFK